MCVILVVNKSARDISTEEFVAAQTFNDDGFGLAWIENKRIKFEKRIGKDTQEFVTYRPPKPYIMHFRIATIGSKEVDLCHPFVIDKNSPLVSSGTAESVLFHNGHWHEWNEWLGITFSGIGHFPKGEYSDSRVMAMMLAHFGPEALKVSGAVQGQRIVVFSADGNIRLIGNWDLNKDDKVYRSNEMHLFHRRVPPNEGTNPCISCGKPLVGKYTLCYTCERAQDNKKVSKGNDTDLSKNFCAVCCAKIPNVNTICPDCMDYPPHCEACPNQLHMESSIVTGLCNSCSFPSEGCNSKSTPAQRAQASLQRRWYFACKTVVRNKNFTLLPQYFKYENVKLPDSQDNELELVTELSGVCHDHKDQLYNMNAYTRIDTPEKLTVENTFRITFQSWRTNHVTTQK